MSRLIEAEKVEKITWEEPTYTDALNVLTEVREKVRELPTIHAIPIEKVKAVREEISDYNIKEHYFGSDSFLIGIANGMDKAVEILDKLIAENEGKE